LIITVNCCLVIVMENKIARSGGRPRSFDRDIALVIAMRLFWRHGYDGVSMQQLTSAIGVAAPSLYAAFGNKSALYLEALDRYSEVRGALDLSMMDQATSLRQAVELVLDATVSGLIDPEGEMGCMINTGMIASHPDNFELVRDLEQRRTAFRILLANKLTRWVSVTRAQSLSRFIVAVMQGMAIQVHDHYTEDELRVVANEALNCVST
jgi:TetR/AcrR family transcriptional regulator, copper-responsive repressor